MISRLVVTALVGPMLTACTGDRPSSSVSQRDSAGIAIVESRSPRWRDSSGWTVDTVPIVDLATSGRGPPHEFYRVRDATRLSDGSIAVADRGSNEIRVFSAAGEFLSSIGGDGDGPGEFRLLSIVDRFGNDSLFAFDSRLRRVTITSLDGRSVRVIPPYSREVRLGNVHPLTDSAFVAVMYDVSNRERDGRISRPLRHVARLSVRTGMLIDTVVSYRGSETFAFSDGTFVGAIAPLFGKSGHVAVTRGQILVGTADSLEYRVFSGDGRLQRIVRVTGYALGVSPAQVAEERAGRLADGAGEIPMLRDAIEGLPRPTTRPAYSALVADAEGHVWLARHHALAEMDRATDWEVFTESGQWLGSVRTPPRFSVYEVGTDYVLGRWQDELDVEHVQVLHLHRR